MDLQAELPPVAGKPTEVEQIVANLLANAEEAMYSAHGGGALKVETRLEGEALILIVQDDGPGIPADVLPRIFEPFFTTKGERGTGLGLAIARRIAREAGGDLEAGNAPTSGARFVLRLPVAVPGVSSGKAPSVAQKGPPLPPAPKSRLQILVVDDEPHIRGALGRFLERQGHRVVLASDFSEAVKSIEAFGFDAILCDVHLPGGTGMKLYTFLRSRRAELRCRFVLMTGDTLGGDVAAFLARHRIPYLAKPFELSEVSRVLDTLVTEPECLESEEQVAGSGGMAE
jgi:two-component system NtrC family sensor kinase